MANIFDKIKSGFSSAVAKVKEVAVNVGTKVKDNFPTIVSAVVNGAANGGIAGAVGGLVSGVSSAVAGGDTYQDVSEVSMPSASVLGNAQVALASGVSSAVNNYRVAQSLGGYGGTWAKYEQTNNFLLSGGLK